MVPSRRPGTARRGRPPGRRDGTWRLPRSAGRRLRRHSVDLSARRGLERYNQRNRPARLRRTRRHPDQPDPPNQHKITGPIQGLRCQPQPQYRLGTVTPQLKPNRPASSGLRHARSQRAEGRLAGWTLREVPELYGASALNWDMLRPTGQTPMTTATGRATGESQSRSPLWRKPWSNLEPPEGVEPSTYALRVRRSDRLS